MIRDGQKKEISADKLVVGDLVYCKSGERVPADIRIIKCEGMRVDNSSLTGESDPLLRKTEAGHQLPLEAKNLAFFSTYCVDGSGYGIVVATGDNTVMGKIVKLVTGIDTVVTPITLEINRFTKIITIMSILLGVAFFATAMGLGLSGAQSFIDMIGIIVGNIPEGNNQLG